MNVNKSIGGVDHIAAVLSRYSSSSSKLTDEIRNRHVLDFANEKTIAKVRDLRNDLKSGLEKIDKKVEVVKSIETFEDDNDNEDKSESNDDCSDGEKKRKKSLEINRIKARERRKRQKVKYEEEQQYILLVSRENEKLRRENEELRRELVLSEMQNQRLIACGEQNKAAHLRSWPVASPKTGFQGELSQDVLLRGRLLQPTNPLALTNQAPATNTAISSQSSATLQQARILELLHCAQTTQTTQSRSVISQDVLPAQNQGQPLNGAALKRLFQAARIGTLK
mmetsp:Transcript_12581/g.18174  ORF Transcript_12581/g.18174 Transcript_12581/m.18174 type:complete len:281 (+) Transcript_12581:156-998(+)|eukprot:CAMPEP_0195538074 /NCGR_PEP_ID=MMETSP0794_2-20130614/49163_1 /TAXON_ID=515487 /ORGANISM="Stephanopyxis turris, Strain CCMP 815" /LENGTH=280 /DNA_ID=CAMNT_0040672007 /DNA_START=93 /DNA_END=935 /DNA_ORIENTATION=-